MKQTVETPIAPSSDSMVIVGVLGDAASMESRGQEPVTEHGKTMLTDVTSVQQQHLVNDQDSEMFLDASMETIEVPQLTPNATNNGKKKKGSITRGYRK